MSALWPLLVLCVACSKHAIRGQPASVAACPVLIDGFEPRALTPGDSVSRRAFERHLRGVSENVGGTSLSEPDAEGSAEPERRYSASRSSSS